MTPLRYLVRVNDRVIGPHALEVLQQMASVQSFDENAPITPEGTEQWTPIRDLPELRTILFPSARKFQFKDKPFTAVNKPSNEPITVEEMLRGNLAQAKPFEAPVTIENPRPNRRRRDFLGTLFFCYAGVGVLVWFVPRNPLVSVCAVSFAAVFTVGLYWVFYHVMDKY